MKCYRDKPLAHKSLFIGSGLQICTHVYVCIIYTHMPTCIIQKVLYSQLYSRPRTLASTGAKVPVAPVQSAPMLVLSVAKGTEITNSPLKRYIVHISSYIITKTMNIRNYFC